MDIFKIIKEEIYNSLTEKDEASKVYEPSPRIEKVITHGGMFHADELLAISILKTFENPNLSVERKNEVTEEEINDPSTMILDVGKVYNPQNNQLDHHQDGSLPASCTLVLDWLGKMRGLHIGNTNIRALSDKVSQIDTGKIGGGGPLDFFNSRIKHFNFIPDGLDQAFNLSDIATKNVMNGKNWDESKDAHQLISIAEKKRQENAEETKRLWNDPTIFHKERDYAYKLDPDDSKFVKWDEIESKKPHPIKYVMTGRARNGSDFGVNTIDPKKYPIEPDEAQTFLHPNKFYATYRTLEDAIRHMKEMTSDDLNVESIVKEETLNYLKEEEYFDTTLPDDIKRLSNRYVGRSVIWYGDPDQMIVIHKDFVDGMFGNIYNPEKLQFVQDMIRHSEDYVELECSYALGSIVDFRNIVEEQRAVAQDRFEIDYDGSSHAASIGDDDLDKYIGAEDLDDTDLWGWDEIDLYEFLNDNRFFLINGKSVDELKQEINEVRKKVIEETDEDFSEDDLVYINDFIEIETQLNEAVENQDGDINDFRIQLRDAHHRIFGAIAAGEQYVCVNLDKEDIKRYKGYYTKVNTKGPIPESEGLIDEVSYGYRAGNLEDVPEKLNKFAGGRGTGHFGTGFYFFGDEKTAINYDDREVNKVDFDKYNLLRVTNDGDGLKLHDALKNFEGINIKAFLNTKDKIYLEQLFTSERNGNPDYRDIDIDKTNVFAENITYPLKKFIKNNKEIIINEIKNSEYGKKDFDDIDLEIEEEYTIDENKGHYNHVYNYIADKLDKNKIKNVGFHSELYNSTTFMEYFNSLIDSEINSYIDKMDKTKVFYDYINPHINVLAKIVSKIDPQNHNEESAKEILQKSIIPLLRRDTYTKQHHNKTTLGTELIKSLGYNGIDVRGTNVDNSGYGSVIYDLNKTINTKGPVN